MLMATTDHAPGAPAQVVMPAALLPRLPQMLAVLGLKLYQLPTKDGPTLLVAADMQELGGGTTLRTPDDVAAAWSLAVAILSEPVNEKTVKRRPRKKSTAA